MMKKNLLLFVMACVGMLSVHAQELRAYQIYNKDGQTVNFNQMINSLNDFDVVLFGEYHDNSMIHWLEFKTEEALFKVKGDKLVLGAEMFERDNQPQVSEYLSGEIDEKGLEKDARLWPNYKTDYKPLLDFAKTNHLTFVATNIPRRYAALVAKNGLDTLSNLPDTDKSYMMKLPVKVDMATPGYPEMADMMKEHAGDQAMNFIAAQAVKDATMAESILKNLKRKELFLHFNGNYHSKEYGGIYWYLKKAKKRLKVAVITAGMADDAALSLPADFKVTEFNIIVPEDITKTY